MKFNCQKGSVGRFFRRNGPKGVFAILPVKLASWSPTPDKCAWLEFVPSVRYNRTSRINTVFTFAIWWFLLIPFGAAAVTIRALDKHVKQSDAYKYPARQG